MKVVISGNAGFIGSNLADRLIEQNHEVIGIDNFVTGDPGNVHEKVKQYKADIRNEKLLDEVFKNVDVVFHLAALARIQPSIQFPEESHSVNLTGTLKILEACRKAKVRKIVFSSSSALYDDRESLPYTEKSPLYPKSPYAVQKLACENYIHLYRELHGLDYAIFRFFNVYGPRQILEGDYAAVVGIFLNQHKENKPLTIFGTGDKRRDFTHVSDIVDGLIAGASEDAYPGIVCNLGTGTNHSIKEIASMISSNQVFFENKDGESQETLADISFAKAALKWQAKLKIEDYIKDQVK